MTNPINKIGFERPRLPEISPTSLRPAQPAALPDAGGRPFQAFLADAVTEVRKLQSEADLTIKQLVAGEIKDVTEAMVAVEKADVAFQTMMTVRSKVMTAYEEIMRMQI